MEEWTSKKLQKSETLMLDLLSSWSSLQLYVFLHPQGEFWSSLNSQAEQNTFWKFPKVYKAKKGKFLSVPDCWRRGAESLEGPVDWFWQTGIQIALIFACFVEFCQDCLFSTHFRSFLLFPSKMNLKH